MHARIQRVAVIGRLRVDQPLAASILQATARAPFSSGWPCPKNNVTPSSGAARP
jgi:hypothetical protein